MTNKTELIDTFRLKVEKLSIEYPQQRESILESSIVVYTNWKPSFSFSRHLKDQEIKNKIQSIFNELFL